MDVHASSVDLFWCARSLKTSSCTDIVHGRPFLLKEGGLGSKKCWLLPRWIENSSNFTYLLYKHALKTFLLHVLFTRFFFNCQGVAKQQAEYAKVDEAESRRIEWIHRQEIKGPKPEVPGIVRSLWEAGSGFLEMKWMYIYIYLCVCMCCSADLLMLLFSPLFSQLCKTPVPCLHWLLAGIFDDSEATMKQDCESLDDQSEDYCFHDTHDS